MRRSRSALAFVAALGAACTLATPPPPALEAISPDRAPAGTAVAVSVRGSGFVPWMQADLDTPEASTVHGAFALALVREGVRVPLELVVLVSDRELSARVPPVATPAVYDLELVDPRGRTVVLPAAFTVEPAPGCGPDGTPCDDGNVCTTGDACQGGVCAPGAPTCPNTAPRACLTVTPAVVSPGEPITVDASCSADDEDPASALRARFDVHGDGSWSALAPVTRAIQLVVPSTGPLGLRAVTVEVVDPRGVSDFASRYVVVTTPGDRVVVTTADDENDPGATPGQPGASGLSLREAVSYVNGLGAARTIVVGVAEPIVHASALPALTVPGAAIVGDAAAPLEFPGVALPCVTLDAPDQLLLGATVTGCTATAVQLGTGSDGAQVAECTIAAAAGAYGISGKATGTIGPRNVISGVGAGVRLSGVAYVVEENRIQGNDAGISVVSAVDLVVRRNRIVANRTFGLRATPSLAPCTLLHNVFDANGGDAVDTLSFGVRLVARNNLFTRSGGFGIRSAAGASLDHNGFFGNALGPMSSGAPGATDLLADPLYAGDHRLSPASPAIDEGFDTGLDLNGPAAGFYDGAAPDLGAWESPPSYPGSPAP